MYRKRVKTALECTFFALNVQFSPINHTKSHITSRATQSYEMPQKSPVIVLAQQSDISGKHLTTSCQQFNIQYIGVHSRIQLLAPKHPIPSDTRVIW